MSYTITKTDNNLDGIVKQVRMLLLAEGRNPDDADDKFLQQLRAMGYSPIKYLLDARKRAKKQGYDPHKLMFAMDNDHKLRYDSPEGIKFFGKAGYGDYLIWSHKENQGLVREGYAKMKRKVFRTSHSEISKIHNLGKYSPNELSIRIIW
jgi:hypothetical protein